MLVGIMVKDNCFKKRREKEVEGPPELKKMAKKTSPFSFFNICLSLVILFLFLDELLQGIEASFERIQGKIPNFSENSRRLWLFLGSVQEFCRKVPGKLRENCWKFLPES